jgi:hypothetical protein
MVLVVLTKLESALALLCAPNRTRIEERDAGMDFWFATCLESGIVAHWAVVVCILSAQSFAVVLSITAELSAHLTVFPVFADTTSDRSALRT